MTHPARLTFESARLRYTPLSLEDIDLAIEQWTDPEVVKFVADRTYSEDELREEMPTVTRRAGRGCIGIWALTDKSSGDKVGSGLLLPLPVEADDTEWDLVQGDEIPNAEIEVGYVLTRKAWGQGYATEACRRLITFAFEETPLSEVVATIDPDNHASRRVLLKCGLTEEGPRRAYALTLPGFRITRRAWQSMHREEAP
ncbi:MAG: GNAT family N-acetyltransferase [Pseudomonadota bacterium]